MKYKALLLAQLLERTRKRVGLQSLQQPCSGSRIKAEEIFLTEIEIEMKLPYQGLSRRSQTFFFLNSKFSINVIIRAKLMIKDSLLTCLWL